MSSGSPASLLFLAGLILDFGVFLYRNSPQSNTRNWKSIGCPPLWAHDCSHREDSGLSHGSVFRLH
jgi:hypothetical protein